jgi:hypothetical protein
MSRMIVGTCLLAAAVAVRAQTPAPPAPVPPVPPTPPAAPVPPAFPFGAGDDMMRFVSSELAARSVIKGAPYSAIAVNETRQVLSDGNRIERSSSISLYRDSQGRTRQEQANGAVFINDVVAGKGYVLNTQQRSARELRTSPRVHVPPVPPMPPVPPAGAAPPPPQPPKPHSQMSAEEARSWGEDMRRWARELTERIRGEHGESNSERIRERKIIISDAAAGQSHVVADHVEVIRSEDGHVAFHSMPSTAMMPPPGPGTTTPLGSRDFDGVRADGKKTTWTIPPERIGNKLPIEIVSERWHSPELSVVVFTRHADPRSGERIYRLENIKREEPSAELFKVPADYALKAAPTPRDADRK